jgi:hypothetical protein
MEKVSTIVATKGYPFVAQTMASAMHDGLSGLQRPAPLGVRDDRQGETVLHGAAGIEGLYLDVHLDVLGRDAVQANHGRVADGFQDVVVDHWCAPPACAL